MVITPSQVFFQCSKPSCLALLSPKTNFVLVQKSQFHTNFNICDHIDLASFTFFLETGYVCLSHFMGKFQPKFVSNITKMSFKTYLITLLIQKRRKKNNLRRSRFSKKRGGGRARYDHDHRFNVFFVTPYLNQLVTELLRTLLVGQPRLHRICEIHQSTCIPLSKQVF